MLRFIESNKMPNLSIITINYNNLPGLQKTMQSVFEQTFTDYEYIIIDGGSTDGSKEYIHQYANKLAYWVSEKDKGIYDAINKGILKANGEYCMFLNSGDFLLRTNVLESAFKIVENNDSDIYYADVCLEEVNGETWVQHHAPVLDLKFLQKRTLNHQASLIRSSLFNELGLYNLDHGLAADYAFYLKAFLSKKKFLYISDVWVQYKRDGISSNNMQTYMEQMQTIWRSMVPLEIRQKIEHDSAANQQGASNSFFKKIYSLVAKHKN